MNKQQMQDHNHSGSPSPDRLDTTQLLPPESVKPPYHERKDQLITKLAVAIIGATAFVAGAALFWQIVYPPCIEGFGCKPEDYAVWPAEMLRLTLVASLAFVMGNAGSRS